MAMSFEILPNELLLEVFKYLSYAQLNRAFRGLNSRFNNLLLQHFQKHSNIDFRSASKYDFDIYCSQFLPQLIDRIQSLCLSDDNNTPKQIDQFYKYGFTLRQFINLKSLSLYSVYSMEIMNKIMLDLQHLSNLTHLTIDKCCTLGSYHQLVDNIWRLPKLVYCHLNISSNSSINPINPTVISSTIRHLSGVHSFTVSSNDFRLFEYTPHLQYFSANIYGSNKVADKTFDVTSIRKLNVSLFKSNIGDVVNILQRMRNLRDLKLDTENIYIDGNIWERIILNYLPELKNFQWKMENKIPMNLCDIEKHIDAILDSFRSRFWLVEHQWFIQCNWNPASEKYFVYTVPYAFDNFIFDFSIYSKSTCPSNSNPWSYNTMRMLNHHYDCDCVSRSHIQFSNIQHLVIKQFPVGDHLQVIIPTLEQLISLDITLNNKKNCLHSMKLLISRAPRLSSMRIGNWFLAMGEDSPFELKDTSISELDLRFEGMRHGYYNNEQCARLSCSTLGTQCKVLTIDVSNPSCLLDLITKMKNLQVLNVRCENIKWNVPLNTGELEDDVVGWLQQLLQSTSIIITCFTRFESSDSYSWKQQLLIIERS